MKKRKEKGIILALALLLAVAVFVCITAFTPLPHKTSYLDTAVPSPAGPDGHHPIAQLFSPARP